MTKVLHIAWREFSATVSNKTFLIGLLLPPALIAVMLLLLPRLLDEESPRVEGQVAILDPTGQVLEAARHRLSPAILAESRAELPEELERQIPGGGGELVGRMASPMVQRAIEKALGEVPVLEVIEIRGEEEVELEKAALLAEGGEGSPRLALVVVHENAIERRPGESEFGSYDIFVREKLDDRVISEIQGALRQVVLEGRIRARGLDPDEIQALTWTRRTRPRTITLEGELESAEVLNVLLPMGCMMLLVISVMTGGQHLMISTIEEKSSRVVEVLLAAVSPMQLLGGKILGQMGVSLVLLGLYLALGIAALVVFAFAGLVDPRLFFYMVIFFLISYLVIASMMAAIGAAVNEMREAQALLLPVMMIVMIPWLLWMPITRDPSSLFSTVISLLPPVGSYAMMLRLASTSPPPLWQVWLSIALGAASVYACLWLAAKIFRVGLLMFGKPPNLKTLLRWVRMA